MTLSYQIAEPIIREVKLEMLLNHQDLEDLEESICFEDVAVGSLAQPEFLNHLLTLKSMESRSKRRPPFSPIRKGSSGEISTIRTWNQDSNASVLLTKAGS